MRRLQLGGRLLHVLVWHLVWWPVSVAWEAAVPARMALDGFRADFVLEAEVSDRARLVIIVLSMFPAVCRAVPAPRVEVALMAWQAFLWQFSASWFFMLRHPVPKPIDPMPGILAWAGTEELYEAKGHTIHCIPPIILCVALTPFLTRALLRQLGRLRADRAPSPP